MKIANRDARRFVDGCISFKGNNLFGEILGVGLYVVYSYGSHFPIYAKSKDKWYGDMERTSVATTKHQRQACPFGDIKYVSLEELQELIAGRLRAK